MNKIYFFSLFLTSFSAFSQKAGQVDTSFNSTVGANNTVYYSDNYPGGKILIGGVFTSYNNTPINKLVRLNVDGKVDTTFKTGLGPNDDVWVLQTLPNGKILIAGNFTSYNGIPCNRIARINTDGSLDQTFYVGHGANSWVHMILVQADGKIILGGRFTVYDSQNIKYLVRLNQNGSLDPTFNFNNSLNDAVINGTLSSDGKILLGGDFGSYQQSVTSKICRLNSDGTLDQSFNTGSGASHQVRSFAIQPDGKIIIAGYFVTFNGQEKNRIARLMPNGSLDSTFIASPSNIAPIYRIERQQNGKLIVGGSFSNFAQSNYSFLVRLEKSGKIDTSFKTGQGPDNAIQTFSIMPNGNIIAGGFFSSINGKQSGKIARIYGDSLSLPIDNQNLIEGKVFTDQNDDCFQSVNEVLAVNRLIKVEPGPYWGNTLSTGKFAVHTDTGTYFVSQVKSPFEKLLENQICPPGNQNKMVVFGNQLGDTISNVNFANDAILCPIIKVDVSANRRRRCFRNQTVVSVSNVGNVTAKNITAHLKLPKFINLISSSSSFFLNSIDTTYEFLIDSLQSGLIKSISIIDSVSCISGLMGIEQCTKAWLTPEILCIPNPIGWDGVNLKVNGKCLGSIPSFKIKNEGNSMTTKRPFQLYADSLLVFADSVLIAASDSVEFLVPNAQFFTTYRLQIAQSDYHPLSSFEAYGLSCDFIPRSSAIFATSDESPTVSIHCSPIRDSYDPNDKLVYPKGSTAIGNVLPGRFFDYQIRFQNTGNDTAYKVVIVDTLDEDFDFSTFEQGLSSHKYRLEVSGLGRPVLKWIFNNIMLPDSFVNVQASNGFVNFRIRPRLYLALGTKLENLADIYFDFNDPIRTNTTLNTLHIPTLTTGRTDSVRIISSKKMSKSSENKVFIYPNPSTGKFLIKTKLETTIRVLSLQGQVVKNISEPKFIHEMDLNGSAKGFYLLELNGAAGKQISRVFLY